MTEREKIEREIILDILAESSKWRISEEDQTDDCIRLEVMDRAKRLLLGTETVDANGYAQSHPEVEVSPVLTEDDYKALEAAKANDHLDEHIAPPEKMWQKQWKWKIGRVRCQENGKAVWHPMRECHKEKLFPDNPKSKKFRWVWDGPQDKEVNKLSDELWEAHENGND